MLETIIFNEIKEKGPLTQNRFMELALGHPQYGYYRTQEAVSRDFTTAPEISQMFGEMIGLWILDLYQKLDSPQKVTLVELGPGKGTLMADILRVTHSISDAVKVYLVEINPLLRNFQQLKLPHASSVERFEDIPKDSGPLIIIANEFFDALPTQCFTRRDNVLYERCIIEKEGKLSFVFSPKKSDIGPNQIWEESPATEALFQKMCSRLYEQKGAFLCIDYGYEKGKGDSLQALYKGKPSRPLCHLGKSDLTSHVNFGRLKEAAQNCGLGTLGPLSQRDFLLNMGLDVRLNLLKNKNISQSAKLELAVDRLINPLQMGLLFKAMAFFSPNLQNLIGFESCK